MSCPTQCCLLRSKPYICKSVQSLRVWEGECRGKTSERQFESTSCIFLPHSSNLGKLAQINGDCFALKCLIAGERDNSSLVKSYWYEGQPMQTRVLHFCDSLPSGTDAGVSHRLVWRHAVCKCHACKTSGPFTSCPEIRSSFQSWRPYFWEACSVYIDLNWSHKLNFVHKVVWKPAEFFKISLSINSSAN